ncbi:uncharacterized protein AC631_02535 [Debaryomyces fabryi]|uniref:Uncharacterized protein n=1 Tax=Debaryomyces fabryi TaxID=58627 RepID=A0A0V1Q0M7_9ASCO|nr:uncharacterized protein AC631_02535 [Debaryomyces fabryi]KSA01727.1 hypothetical protein AC631_02535 [Debaryomyces fabryi]CUM45237.1 unnamed protein product [Debaryomyces fabryi]
MNQENITRTPPRNDYREHEEIENETVSAINLSKIVKDGLSNTQSQKRGPTTPLTPRNKQHNVIRRKMEEEPGRIRDILSFGKDQSIDIIDLNYRNWVLNENLKKHQDIVKFMELERKFLLEEL